MQIDILHIGERPNWEEASRRAHIALETAGALDDAIEHRLQSTPDEAARVSFAGSLFVRTNTDAKAYVFVYDRGMSIATRVLTSSEARTALPSLGAEIEREGIGFAPVLFGAHRKPVGAIVSVALLDQLVSLLEDVVIAPEIHERIERGAGEASMAQIAEGLGLDPADFA